jgi:hypothetical protein
MLSMGGEGAMQTMRSMRSLLFLATLALALRPASTQSGLNSPLIPTTAANSPTTAANQPTDVAFSSDASFTPDISKLIVRQPIKGNQGMFLLAAGEQHYTLRYTYSYIHIHNHIHTHTHTYTYSYIHILIHAHTHTYSSHLLGLIHTYIHTYRFSNDTARFTEELIADALYSSLHVHVPRFVILDSLDRYTFICHTSYTLIYPHMAYGIWHMAYTIHPHIHPHTLYTIHPH